MSNITGQVINSNSLLDVPVSVVFDYITGLDSVTPVTRLLTSNGIPMLGEVNSFTSLSFIDPISGYGYSDGTTVYTVPLGYTFYIMAIVVSKPLYGNQASDNYLYSFGNGNAINITVPQGTNATIQNNFPVAIVASGNSITLTKNGSGAGVMHGTGMPTFVGYLLQGGTV